MYLMRVANSPEDLFGSFTLYAKSKQTPNLCKQQSLEYVNSKHNHSGLIIGGERLTCNHLAVLFGYIGSVGFSGDGVGFFAFPAALENEFLKIGVGQGYGRNFKVQLLRNCQKICFDLPDFGKCDRGVDGGMS